MTPFTGTPCSCKPGVQRDNCSACEGTGRVVDFAAIHRERYMREHAEGAHEGKTFERCPSCRKEGQ